jgi:hypothetical protein
MNTIFTYSNRVSISRGVLIYYWDSTLNVLPGKMSQNIAKREQIEEPIYFFNFFLEFGKKLVSGAIKTPWSENCQKMISTMRFLADFSRRKK